MQEAALVIGLVLQRFKLIDHTRYQLKIKETLTLKPDGLRIKVRRRTDYPAVLLTTGLNDPRVPYWEPAKWVAKLRTQKSDQNVLLFKTRMDPGGHGGASGRYDRLRDTAFEYAFMLWNLGIKK